MFQVYHAWSELSIVTRKGPPRKRTGAIKDLQDELRAGTLLAKVFFT
jgi:hypothetical protein